MFRNLKTVLRIMVKPQKDDAGKLVFETDHLSDEELAYAAYGILVDLEDRLVKSSAPFKKLFDEFFRLVRKYNK